MKRDHAYIEDSLFYRLFGATYRIIKVNLLMACFSPCLFLSSFLMTRSNLSVVSILFIFFLIPLYCVALIRITQACRLYEGRRLLQALINWWKSECIRGVIRLIIFDVIGTILTLDALFAFSIKLTYIGALLLGFLIALVVFSVHHLLFRGMFTKTKLGLSRISISEGRINVSHIFTAFIASVLFVAIWLAFEQNVVLSLAFLPGTASLIIEILVHTL